MWYVHESKLHAEERGIDEEIIKGKHGLHNATHVRQSACEMWMILSIM